jgi:SNF2 family DNA or RNA helicase
MSLVRSRHYNGLRAICDVSNFGLTSYTTAALPDRVYTGLDAAERPPSIALLEADLDVTHLPTPLESLVSPNVQSDERWAAETRRTLGRLEAMWLLIEDRHRLLDVLPVEPLAHQASLVEHVVSTAGLRKVLIADEVGLGKTIEAGLIIQRLQQTSASPLRVLYLTEARLVENVFEEFERLGLKPRRWTAYLQEARLGPGDVDPLVIASTHRAVHHDEAFAKSGPWDVIIVDEAHHLTDWSDDGSSPQERMKLARTLVRDRLVPQGYLILLTGTPHQGHEHRFRNVLRLLSSDGKTEAEAGGRVIYRIKDDIRDWNGQPLFPIRCVNPPTLVEVGRKYYDWLASVHLLFSTGSSTTAAGWRRAQALQWCASSPQAGLAYLVRLALRMGMTSYESSDLHKAIAALRPYREGRADESIDLLEARLVKTREPSEEEDEGVQGRVVDPTMLADVLRVGTTLVAEDALAPKLRAISAWLQEHPDEKFVIFAQPVETVYTLNRRLERILGPDSVALIVGEQSREVRNKEIARFWQDPNVRALVSSRSGGEGINLQVSRRLVHFDVPWNPMEMEQRVGRVHRYGGLQTIIVETLVLKDSRERRILDRARARLGRIVGDLDRDRQEFLFGRTMSLISTEELQSLMAGENFGPLTQDEETRLDRLVTKGYQLWQEADQKFRVLSDQLQILDRGEVTEADLEDFLTNSLQVPGELGWTRRAFEGGLNGSEPVVKDSPAVVYRLGDGTLGYVGRDAGVGLFAPGYRPGRPRRLGLNVPWIAGQLRQAISGAVSSEKSNDEQVSGAGLALVPRKEWREWAETAGWQDRISNSGALFLTYCIRKLDPTGSTVRELASELQAWIVTADGTWESKLTAAQTGALVRLIRRPRPKRTRPDGFKSERLLTSEASRLPALRARKAGEPLTAVFPISAIWIEPTT